MSFTNKLLNVVTVFNGRFLYLCKLLQGTLMLPTTSAAKPYGIGWNSHSNKFQEKENLRPAFVWLALFVLLISSSWAVYHFQFQSLPTPIDAEQAGEQGFSEASALEHVKFLTSLGPHSVGSDALDVGVQVWVANYCFSIPFSNCW